MKGFIYRLSCDSHLDVVCDVSAAFCRSSTGGSVDLLSWTICTTVVVSDWYVMNIAHGWSLGGSPCKTLLALLEEDETVPP